MSAELIRTINRQLLELDRINGAVALALDVLRAFKSTVESYEGEKTKDNLMREFCKLHDLFMGCRPRMAQVILDTQRGLLHIAEQNDPTEAEIQRLIDESIELKKAAGYKIVDLAADLVKPEQTLFIHSYSTHLAVFLEHMAKNNKKPKVLVAEQEEVKTEKLVKLLDKHRYDFHLVSEYSVSHILDKVDVALFGALTINHSKEIVLAPGSSGLVSDLHRAAIPTYALIPTGKFSYWEEDYEPMYTETRKKDKYGVLYEKDIYSHDIIPLQMFTGSVTEKGILNHNETMAVFSEKQKQFLAGEIKIKELKKQLHM